MFEPIWNRIYINSIQITMAERFGVQDHGKFYDETGAIRDVFQNHLLQLLASLTMDPPARNVMLPIDQNVKSLIFSSLLLGSSRRYGGWRHPDR
jgi:glucose-6-phosphate 1-dehydrogenase